jgi:hypothetical protein
MPTYGSVIFDGNGGVGTVGHNSDIDLTGQTATIEMWLRGVNPQASRWLCGKTNGTGNGYGVRINTGNPQFCYGTGAAIVAGAGVGTGLFDGVWRHLAWVKSAAGTLAYVNGSQVATSAVGAGVSLLTSAAGFTVSGLLTTNVFGTTQMAEVRLWNTARTAAELLALRDVFAVGTETGLVGLWHMNENTGTSAVDSAKAHSMALTLAMWANPTAPPWVGLVGGTGLPGGVPVLLWEGDTTGPALIAHAADYYHVEVTSVGAGVGRLTVPFGTWYPDIGNIAIIGPANAVRETQRLRYGLNEIWPQVRPADQLYLNVLPGIECHTQAWTLV